jgi:hypothetical protein
MKAIIIAAALLASAGIARADSDMANGWPNYGEYNPYSVVLERLFMPDPLMRREPDYGVPYEEPVWFFTPEQAALNGTK